MPVARMTFAHVVEVAHGDEVFQTVELTDAESQRVITIAKPAIDRSRHEIRREDTVVCQPANNDSTEKSKLTTVWTEITSGVASPASSR